MKAPNEENFVSAAQADAGGAFGTLRPWLTQFVPAEAREADHADAAAASRTLGPEQTLTALHAAECLVRQLFDDSPISVAMLDRTGRILKVNRALGAMLGYAPEELMNRTLDDIVHPDDLPSLQEGCGGLVEGRCDVLEVEARSRLPGRPEVWMRISARAERSGGRGSARIFAHLVDITVLRQTVETARHDAEQNHLSWDPDRYMD